MPFLLTGVCTISRSGSGRQNALPSRSTSDEAAGPIASVRCMIRCEDGKRFCHLYIYNNDNNNSNDKLSNAQAHSIMKILLFMISDIVLVCEYDESKAS